MREYHERLGAPASWWLVAAGFVLVLGTTFWAGLSLLVAVATYVVLGIGCAALLLIWGGTTIEVTGGDLRVGSRRLPLSRIGEVAPMDSKQTTALRGPQADPAAYLLIRPYLPQSVYIEVADNPYWLIGTRHPARLADAIDQARPRAGENAPWDDAAGDHASAQDEAGPVDAAHPGKESNAW